MARDFLTFLNSQRNVSATVPTKLSRFSGNQGDININFYESEIEGGQPQYIVDISQIDFQGLKISDKETGQVINNIKDFIGALEDELIPDVINSYKDSILSMAIEQKQNRISHEDFINMLLTVLTSLDNSIIINKSTGYYDQEVSYINLQLNNNSLESELYYINENTNEYENNLNLGEIFNSTDTALENRFVLTLYSTVPGKIDINNVTIRSGINIEYDNNNSTLYEHKFIIENTSDTVKLTEEPYYNLGESGYDYDFNIVLYPYDYKNYNISFFNISVNNVYIHNLYE